VHAVLVLGVLVTSMPSAASNWGARREYREGMREIARERREMRREIMRSGSRAEARREYHEGMREIARERREARREIGRELRYGRWERDRDRGAELFAGIVLGAVVAAAVRGSPPPPPSPELCWVWSDPRQESGWWDRCDRY
jgi:Spy/CpxP family protein refolding chaperone